MKGALASTADRKKLNQVLKRNAAEPTGVVGVCFQLDVSS
ncbi:hypothetical protein AIOL_003076 [Candidatus Rhodobacter oscarellae]|uniref:Uncharacterized protein n=1 Tax=Candidatus Rhodobacter oscarellae TaxID=1675527 RepID=A0A0J9E5S1_9RHOB|nr:hypothetical protein AIOL_003076 [Candidatus Rhodobacter lobularis]